MSLIEKLGAALAGRYAIERELGSGGMATVFLARDLRHDRLVALKLLKPELGAVLGGERFLSEIRVTANLQHPNLLPLFDSGEANGMLFYVMPFVEGESLRQRLDRERQLPVPEALRLTLGVAGALDYAHRRGVIHRDLKPENILLQEGQPLVADFGIALAVSNAGGTRITQTGLSLGTPQYMSPEQATGDRAIDGRADIYSLAAVLYEMLTGDPPHTGSTVQAVIAKVLTETPRSVRGARPAVPEHVEMAIICALAKLPADRFGTAREFADALSGESAGLRSRAAPLTRDMPVSADQRVPASHGWSFVPWTVAVLSLGVGAAGLLRGLTRRTADAAPAARFVVSVPDSSTPLRVLGPMISISPDGSKLLTMGGTSRERRLYLRPLDQLDATPLRGTEGATRPAFSRDGGSILFLVDTRLKRMPLAGGPAVTIGDSVGQFHSGEGDVVVYAWNGGLWRVAGGNPPEMLTQRDSGRGERQHGWPHLLPGGRAVVFSVLRTDALSAELAVVRVGDTRIRLLGPSGVNPRYIPTGHLIWGQANGTLAAAPFDLRELRLTGPAVTVLEDVVIRGGGAVEAAISDNGVLAYLDSRLAWRVVTVDRTGTEEVVLREAQLYAYPRFSPDGSKIAVGIRDDQGMDIWVHETASGTLTRLTTGGINQQPAWSADGSRLIWMVSDATRRELWWQRWDGSGAPERLLADEEPSSPVVSRSGNRLAYMTNRLTTGGGFGVQVRRLDSMALAPIVIPGGRITRMPSLSPDGRWIAYVSNESGRLEVFARPLAGAGGRHQISLDGGDEPVWSPTGREIFYRANGWMMAAVLDQGAAFRVVRRDRLFPDQYAGDFLRANYDVSRDGSRFLLARARDSEARLIVATRWFEELRGRFASRDSRP